MVARKLESSFASLAGGAVVGLTLGVMSGGPASAQPAAGAPGGANAPESIVVTARRREESLQDTPVAVTVLNVEALEERQVVSTTDLDNVAPNLQFHSDGTLTGNNAAAQVFIRGVGQTDATPAVDPGVGVYIDDVYTNEDENGSPFVFREINEAATFMGAASQAAGCPDMIDPLPPPVLVGPLADPRCGNDAQALGPFTNGGTYPASSTLENRGSSVVVDWDVNETFSLKSITADRTLDWTGTRDADNTPLLILHTNYNSKSEQFSQEFQALVETERADGVFGLYYFDEDSFDRLLVPLGNPGTSYDTQRVSMDATAKAAFTEWTFKISDAFNVSAGVRYTRETKGLQASMFNVSPATAPEPPIPSALCPFAGPPPTQTGCLFITTNRFAPSSVRRRNRRAHSIDSALAQWRTSAGPKASRAAASISGTTRRRPTTRQSRSTPKPSTRGRSA